MEANRTHLEIQALDVLKRVWLKLNCGIDNESDSAIADAAWDCICNDMGCAEAIAWSDAEVPDECHTNLNARWCATGNRWRIPADRCLACSASRMNVQAMASADTQTPK
jgi:hypothetical protein